MPNGGIRPSPVASPSIVVAGRTTSRVGGTRVEKRTALTRVRWSTPSPYAKSRSSSRVSICREGTADAVDVPFADVGKAADWGRGGLAAVPACGRLTRHGSASLRARPTSVRPVDAIRKRSLWTP